jgi:hypothetical protein
LTLKDQQQKDHPNKFAVVFLLLSTTCMTSNKPNEITDPSVEEIVRLTFNPAALVQRVPMTGGILRPLLFAETVLVVLYGLFAALMTSFFHSNFIFALLGISAILPVALLAMGAYQHLFCKIFGGKGTYESSVRAGCYGMVANTLGLIPVLGIVFKFYALYLNVRLLQKAHGFGTARLLACVFTSFIPPVIVGTILALQALAH